ncbi:nucleoside triphosphate pyrophosphatase, partial [Candidatus Nephthysia bennettiae]|uniref:Maf family protein n=1 Tax=Candidatus Nephthysia bennettiae TaxID=3127016 RepID=UPI0030C6DF0A
DLLRAAGFDFDVRPSCVVEWPYPGGDPAEYAEALARAKADGMDGEPVVGADTIVVVDGEVFGKPDGARAASLMLHRLSGRTHEVVTAVAVRDRHGMRSGHDRARVSFRALRPAEVRAYVASGEPLDKAGAYGLQGAAAEFVTAVEGNPQTVIGLPIELLERLLADPPRGEGPGYPPAAGDVAADLS